VIAGSVMTSSPMQIRPPTIADLQPRGVATAWKMGSLMGMFNASVASPITQT